MAAPGIRETDSITGSSINIMEPITGEIRMIRGEEAAVLEICAVICGVPIHCVNVWEVICAHASKVQRGCFYRFDDGFRCAADNDWRVL